MKVLKMEKKIKDETYVLVWVNKTGFYGNVAIDTVNWHYPTQKELKGVKK